MHIKYSYNDKPAQKKTGGPRAIHRLTTELETTLNLRERVSQVARKCEVITRPDDKYSYQCVLTIAINDKHEKNRTDGLKMFSR